MSIDFYSKEALLNAVQAARKPMAFLVGAPLSFDSGGGVPGVNAMLDLVRDEIRVRNARALSGFEDAIRGKSGGEAYRAAMWWLKGNFLQDTVNKVVETAVRRARKVAAAADFEYDGDATDWYIPPGTLQLASLLCSCRALSPNPIPGPVITTNFDPLLSLAIEACGGRPLLRVIQADGDISNDLKRTGDIEVIHLHGFWRGSDTLHTRTQLESDRPKLKNALKGILRQHTLIVVAYGGWDDVFTDALEDAASDNAAQVDVLWCFRDSDADEVERNNRHLLKRVRPALTRGRFAAYGGIDCHTIFGEIAGELFAPSELLAPSVVAPAAGDSPIAGWRLIDAAYLSRLENLGPEDVVRYFDGAVPDWRHAVSDAIPRRQDVMKIGGRLATARDEKTARTLQLIRAAGGEGKSTVLLQAAADAARAGWAVLWRTSPTEGLPPEHVARLDPSRNWLVVADDADSLVADLADSAGRLAADGRAGVHFLLAARDADWRSAKGDEQPWGKWLSEQPEVVLCDITPEDSMAVVRAWAKYEKAGGLRALTSYGDDAGRAAALREAVHDAADKQKELSRRGWPVDGSFFGGLLAVRLGPEGLLGHVRDFLKRLKAISIKGADGSTLFDALLYVAACHGVGISGINENILADLVGVPREWVESRVVRPLGEEATAVHSASHVFTRHSEVAAAVLVEAEKTFNADLGKVWTRLVELTTRMGREPGMRVGQTFSQIVHAGPRLQGALPSQLAEGRRREIAIAAAEAAAKYQREWLGCVDSLAKTYRRAGDIEEAVRLFRASLDNARSKVDYKQVVRAYWYEWSVCEGLRGKGREHAVANAWLGGLSLSDHLNPAPITGKDIKLVCAGLGTVFGRLTQPDPDCPYAKARRAASYLGRLVSSEPTALSYYDENDREADKINTPHPGDVAEAVEWLVAGVKQAGGELRDPFLAGLAAPSEISFSLFRNALPSSNRESKGKVTIRLLKPR